jgi:hypothetical protein
MPISVVRLLSDDGDHPMILLNSFAPPALDGGAASIASEAGFFPLKITEASGPTLKRPAIFVLRIVWCTDGHSPRSCLCVECRHLAWLVRIWTMNLFAIDSLREVR